MAPMLKKKEKTENEKRDFVILYINIVFYNDSLYNRNLVESYSSSQKL